MILEKLIEFFRSLFGGNKPEDNPYYPPTPPPAPPIEPPAPPVVIVDDNHIEEDEDNLDEEALEGDGADLLSRPDSIGTIVFPEYISIPPSPEIPPVVIDELPPIDVVDESQIPEDEPVVPEHTPRYLWCLDNGHGRFTAGKRSPKFENGSRFFEYEFNRDIVKRITEKLDKIGVQYFNVVPEIDTDNFLKGRVDRANAYQTDLPKLFVSIHANAAPSTSMNHWANPGAKGMETWYYKGSRKGQKLATVFQRHMVQYTGMVNRGLKSTRKLYVIRKTSMTAVLTENGFYNHENECKELIKPEVRQSIADAHVAAILEVEKNGI